MGLLHEAKGDKEKAILSYRNVLNQEPYHTPSLINLALLVDQLGDALHYIDIAEKITSENRLWMAKGVLLSKMGRVNEAHELFLRDNEIGWLDMQPALVYY
jgi:tetratricopeptide (TPR) repeat protein